MLLMLLISNFSTTLSEQTIIINHGSNDKSELVSQEDVEYYALIIGVETFVAGNLYPVENKIDDGAIAMYDLLLNCTNWKKENIKIILNENATKDKIQEAIVGWLAEREDENDVVLIFHSGHGWKIPIRYRRYGHAALFTYNETEEHNLEDRITDKEFDTWVDELESKHITIILDTCYSGKMFALRQRGRVLLAAGGKYFFCGVDEDDTLGSGIFSYFLRQGFEGVADINNDGWVTAEEAFRYARRPTIHFSIWKQFPFVYEWMNQTLIWFFQIPWMYDRHLGSIPLIQYPTE